jgi:hypothetical protein
MDIAILSVICLSVILLVRLWLTLGRAGSAILMALVAIALIACFVFVHSFQAFSKQTQVATVHCEAAATVPHTMLVELNGKTYYLGGDLWMLQSSTIEIQSWLHFLGVSSGYTLDRLDSQFDDPSHQTVKPIQLGGFSLYKKTDLWMFFPLIKSAYGSSVVEPCNGRDYVVLVDVNGDMLAHRA